MDKIRDEFEAWWMENMNTMEMDLHRFADGYSCHDTNRGWMAWKASRAVLSENHFPDAAKMVTDGWQFAPKVPTREMIEQGNAAMAYDCCSGDASDAYQAMLAAAPKHEGGAS